MTISVFKKRKVAIFGSTGSIGASTLKIISANESKFIAYILTANNNYKKLIKQARKYKPEYICIVNELHYADVKDALADMPIKIFAGENGLNELAELETDIVISAIMGLAGLSPTLHAIKNTEILALANKESLVCASNFILDECAKYNTKLVPLDSEHNSIYQLLENEADESAINKITITASGGPFLNWDISKFANITLSDALKHPNWVMGKKITVDSATMVNKALEIIEANYLFPQFKNKIEVVVHPESIIHALISFRDGSIKSLLAAHDMRVPISHALSYPDRLEQSEICLNISELGSLNFLKPDLIKFRVLKLVEFILAEGKALPIIFNAANEVMVDKFLKEEILFTDIVNNIEIILDKFKNIQVENLEHLYAIDAEARNRANNLR
ncbi:MAG: 1-deoxy-D-xylulose-5-phosphate reductoisomerase [Alphaproteobacteria bacterium]|jgi:1-deoxy-D-xylulose-5-phosphate reductoisomerase|nr:1-deoxy-D-xylulose-5-phosphate reductoisomerase [Alphaproteobacteria bacterium]MBT5827399.1 1-deoxy-D-xylulose-5-phosphate reductoisomerase [Alphaproteobacteria bacterium]